MPIYSSTISSDHHTPVCVWNSYIIFHFHCSRSPTQVCSYFMPTTLQTGWHTALESGVEWADHHVHAAYMSHLSIWGDTGTKAHSPRNTFSSHHVCPCLLFMWVWVIIQTRCVLRDICIDPSIVTGRVAMGSHNGGDNRAIFVLKRVVNNLEGAAMRKGLRTSYFLANIQWKPHSIDNKRVNYSAMSMLMKWRCGATYNHQLINTNWHVIHCLQIVY